MAIYPRENVFIIQATHTISPELVSEFFLVYPFTGGLIQQVFWHYWGMGMGLWSYIHLYLLASGLHFLLLCGC